MKHSEEKIRAAYRAGLDRFKRGANEENCNFGHFATPEQTRAWELGAAGKKLNITITEIKIQ